MKYNKLVVVLAFCVGMQTNIGLCGEKGQLAESKSVWERYIPQFMQNAANKVNNWKLSTKIAIATLIIGGFAAIYNREQILQWVNSILEQQPELVGDSETGVGAGNDVAAAEKKAIEGQLLRKAGEEFEQELRESWLNSIRAEREKEAVKERALEGIWPKIKASVKEVVYGK